MSLIDSQVFLDDFTRSSEDPFDTLNEFLNTYNNERMGRPDDVPLYLFARDEGGRVLGGVRGVTYWSWCIIQVLAVAKTHRRQGIGSRLLQKAEKIAEERGCIGVWLDTMSFQAPDFYIRNGYAECGRIEDYPPGHTRLWFMKRFPNKNS